MEKTVQHDTLNISLNRDDYPYMPLREMVYSEVRKAIEDTRLVPGQTFTEENLTTQLGVSRTPVREALRKLESEGYITVYHGKYAEVTSINRADLVEEYELREILEGYAAKLAAKHGTAEDLAKVKYTLDRIQAIIDEGGTEFDRSTVQRIVKANLAFHLSVIDASRNGKLSEIMNSLWKTMRMLSTSTLKNREWAISSLEEHRKIYNAIKDRDTALSERLMKQHINNALSALPE